MATMTKEKVTLTPYASPSSTPRLPAVNSRLIRRQGILAQLCTRCGGYSGSDNEYCMKCRSSQWKTNPLMRNYDDVYKVYAEEQREKTKNIQVLRQPEGWLEINRQRTKEERKEKKKRYQERLSIQHTGIYCVECRRSEKQTNGNLCLICDAKRRRRELDKREKTDKVFLFDDMTPRRKKKRQIDALEIVPENTVATAEPVKEKKTEAEEPLAS
ncbi:uncharacterized protein LOC110452244 [Mizuhopecten yessoensis]|uniref:Uncharacterized protein n=1 Tax=Mizuhopecten yessoensis TaxID=6573 RepID=A0A210QJZ7_MIZYE|nr:uncharacterized protein LOC110452244 [Mizuhopecten yessoensis]XP_021356304.1 uncharacterized protein LOC110452244 [Mizuhopecten yessoensis]OWF49077.1 hypothetical protein KP79_PYT20652 [Mizuhopecten yessoensis]